MSRKKKQVVNENSTDVVELQQEIEKEVVATVKTNSKKKLNFSSYIEDVVKKHFENNK